MKIAVISDFHLGVKSRGPRERDPFNQAKEAIERALDLGAEAILILGDIFDERIPKQEDWSEAMKILSIASEKENRNVELADTIQKDKNEISALPLRGTPVIAIHGNHERRGRGFVDSIEALESAGLLIRLHHNAIVLNTPSGKFAMHGMGHVPESYAKDVLDKWNPKPVEGAMNVLMMHQGLGRFTFSSEERPALDPADLPKGFDLYLSGHVHYKIESRIYDKSLIFPGSTVRTQLLPVEAREPKGFYLIELENGDINYEFVKLKSVREFFYEKKEFNEATPQQIEDWSEKKVEEFLEESLQNPEKLPLIRIRLTGTLAKGSSKGEINTKRIEAEFEDRALLSISKGDLSSPELEEKTQFLKDIRKEKISMEERGLEILRSNLEQIDYDQRFDPEMLFNLLSEGRTDEALKKITKKIGELTETAMEEKR